jgi:hypothetical protein
MDVVTKIDDNDEGDGGGGGGGSVQDMILASALHVMTRTAGWLLSAEREDVSPLLPVMRLVAAMRHR